MPEASCDFVFQEPWSDLRGFGIDDEASRSSLKSRLLTEVGPEHGLAARTVETVARFNRQDEVLYRLDGGSEYLMAHLTYTANPPDPFTRLRFFPSWEEVTDMVEEMAENW